MGSIFLLLIHFLLEIASYAPGKMAASAKPSGSIWARPVSVSFCYVSMIPVTCPLNPSARLPDAIDSRANDRFRKASSTPASTTATHTAPPPSSAILRGE
jgi:hypothetical protein